MNQSIVTCQKTVDINSPVILWNTEMGLACPNRRGRSACNQHNPILNNKPSESLSEYSISNLGKAYDELKNYNNAIIDYTRAIRVDPNYASAYKNRGIAKQNAELPYCSDYKMACDLGKENCCEWYYRHCR